MLPVLFVTHPLISVGPQVRLVSVLWKIQLNRNLKSRVFIVTITENFHFPCVKQTSKILKMLTWSR